MLFPVKKAKDNLQRCLALTRTNFMIVLFVQIRSIEIQKPLYATICKVNISKVIFEQNYWFQGHSGIVKLKGGGSMSFLGHVTTIWAELPQASVLDRHGSAPGAAAAAAGLVWVR